MAAQTKPCTNEQDIYKDVDFCRGSRTYPGLRPYGYFIRKRNIVKWPTRKGSQATTLAEIATLDGDFVLVADKKWNKIDLVPDENEISSESVGSYGSKCFNNTVTLIVPGTEEEATGLAAQMNNDDVVFLVPQRNGKFRLIGNDMFLVDVKPNLGTGKKTEDANQTTLTITVTDEIPAPFYPGKIETNDGDISGKDGNVVVAPLP